MTQLSPQQKAEQRIADLERKLLRMQTQEQLRHRVMTGAATLTGRAYFEQMARELSAVLGADITLIGQFDTDLTQVQTLALCIDGALQDNRSYPLAGTPCADVINKSICSHITGVAEAFPKDQMLTEMGIDGYVGTPLHTPDHKPLGLMVALYRKPVEDPLQAETTLQMFASLTSAQVLRQQEVEHRNRLEKAHLAVNEKLFQKGTQLNESHRTLDAIIETLPSPLFFKNAQGVYTGCNQAFCDYLGMNREQIVGHTVYDVAPAELAGIYHRADLKLMQQHGAQTYQAQVRYADGRIRDILFNKATIGDPEGEVLGLVGVMTDITELNETKHFLAKIINAITDPVFVKDDQHRWQIVNDAFCSFVNLPESELIGKSDYDFFPREQADSFWRKDQEVFDSQQDAVNEELLTISPDNVRHLETKTSYFRSGAGDNYLVGVIRDITEIRQTELEMSKLRNLLRNIIDSMPSALITIDQDGRISHWNRQAENLSGRSAEEAVGHKIHEALPLLITSLALIDHALVSKEVQKTNATLHDEQNTLQHFDVLIYPLLGDDGSGAVIRIDNISERVRIQEMMVQTEKMMSLGGLAAGMAHEINNPLAGIMQSLSVIQSRLLSNLPANKQLAAELGLDLKQLHQFLDKRGIPKMIDSIFESSQRAAQTVQSMLSFSRQDRPELLQCNLIEIIEQSLMLAKKDLARGYKFRDLQISCDLPDDLPMILGIKSQLQQVLLNLIKNSAQALDNWDELDSEPQIRINASVKQGLVVIDLADNGPGIEEKYRSRIFEPFFTTKDEQTGTGLGLSVSYYIITNTHNGKMWVDSAPGQGACFHIGLPLTPPAPMYNI